MKAKHVAMHEQKNLVIEFKISIPLSYPFNTSSERQACTNHDNFYNRRYYIVIPLYKIELQGIPLRRNQRKETSE